MKTVIHNWGQLPIILDTKMVALIFDVTPATVKNWIHSGRIRATKIGSRWVFDKDYIKQIIETEVSL